VNNLGLDRKLNDLFAAGMRQCGCRASSFGRAWARAAENRALRGCWLAGGDPDHKVEALVLRRADPLTVDGQERPAGCPRKSLGSIHQRVIPCQGDHLRRYPRDRGLLSVVGAARAPSGAIFAEWERDGQYGVSAAE
jgi:hypothetical protein